MTQLFVNEREVILPSDFSFTLIEENPEITNNGEFTLDITISLRNPQNAIVFGFLNRINLATITKTAPARMIVDGSPRSGTIIISKNTDIDVTFQFVSGNSELNYIAKNEKKIWELDWGMETAIDFEKALESLNYPGYGEYDNTPIPPFYFHTSWFQNFVCAPVIVGSSIINNFTIAPDTDPVETALKINGISGKIIMQPYILYYINKLPSLLGYTLKHNILNTDSRAKKMYLVNAIDSLKYADALPDMTITEFKEAIEFFFNVEFIVNPTDKTVSIENLQSNLENKKIVNITDYLDEYNRDQSQDSKSVRLDFSKVSYDLPGTNYFRYQKLDQYILDKSTIVEFVNFAVLEAYTRLHNGSPANKFLIYRDLDQMNDYMFIDINSAIGRPWIVFYMYPFTLDGNFDYVIIIDLINKFSSVGTDATKELVLKISPAEVLQHREPVHINSGNTFAYTQLPKSSSAYFIEESKGFIETVQGTEVTIPRLSKLEVSLYTGRIKSYQETQIGYTFDIPTLYPFSHIDTKPEFSGALSIEKLMALKTWVNTYFSPAATETMKLKGPGGIISDYHQQTIIDTTKEYTFYLIDGPNIRANNIFIINNLKYMPITFERIKSEKQTTVKGTFYRML